MDADFVSGGRYVVGASRSFDTNACTVTEAGTRIHQPHARRAGHGRFDRGRSPDRTGGADPLVGGTPQRRGSGGHTCSSATLAAENQLPS